MEKKNWFNKEVEEIEKELETHKEKGLKEEQITKIREQKGFNELQAGKKKTILQNADILLMVGKHGIHLLYMKIVLQGIILKTRIQKPKLIQNLIQNLILLMQRILM